MEGASGTEGGVQQTAGVEKQPVIQAQKEQRWQEVKNEFTKDKLGHENDAGILDTVVGLSVVGVNTDKSCEGHIDSSGAPYIDVKAKDTVDIAQLYEMSAKEETRDTARKLGEETTRLNLKEREKLMGQLSAFYQNRQVPYDRRLTIQSRALGVGRLESQGAEVQKIASQEVKQQRLQEYQEEMRAFGIFLKQTYISATPSVKPFAISSSEQSKPEVTQKIVETAPVEPPVEKVDLGEQVEKLKKLYDEERGEFAMIPFWYACSQVLNHPPEEIRQFISRCNPLLVKKILDASAEELNGKGYRNNRLTMRAKFTREGLPINQAKEEVIRSITEVAMTLDSTKSVDREEEKVEDVLKKLQQKTSYGDLQFLLHPACYKVMEQNKPKWGSNPEEKLTWVVIGNALAEYMQEHYKHRFGSP